MHFLKGIALSYHFTFIFKASLEINVFMFPTIWFQNLVENETLYTKCEPICLDKTTKKILES